MAICLSLLKILLSILFFCCEDKNFIFLSSGIGSLNLSQVQVLGIKELYENHANEETKGVKVHFRLDDSGVLRLDKVFFYR